jgi:hypothetical protein
MRLNLQARQRPDGRQQLEALCASPFRVDLMTTEAAHLVLMSSSAD